jgi:uncharacterized protein (TIGR03435 family)
MKRLLYLAGCCAALLGAANIPKFEVASVKPAAPGAKFEAGIKVDGAQAILTNWPLKRLLSAAFKIGVSRIDGPAWINSAHYDIAAKAGKKFDDWGQMYPMLGPLVEERFSLKMHRENRVVDAFNLVIATKGKLPAPSPGNCIERDPRLGPTAPEKGKRQMFPCGMIVLPSLREGAAAFRGGKVQMKTLADYLSSIMGRPVFDKTGYTQSFDIDVSFTFEGFGHPAPGSDASDPNGLPDITSAIRSKLGLKLESAKGPVEYLVIDRIQQPTTN